MKKMEQEILCMAEAKKDVLFFIAITLLGVAVRLSGKEYISPDMNVFLLPWYEAFQVNGGFASLKGQVGDYGIPYQFLIAAMSYIPLNPLYLYKILSCIFDFGLAFVSAKFVCALKQEKSTPLFLVTYGLILISPPVVLNSSIWGQCDSIYVFFLVLGCYCLWLGRHRSAFAWIGISFAFKLQAVFVLPFLIFWYVKEKRLSIVSGFGISALAFYAMQLPGLIMGRSPIDPIRIYWGQIGAYRKMWLNYPSFWVMVGDDYTNLKFAAILFTVCILGTGLYMFLHSAARLTHAGVFLGLLTWSAWTCVLFLPSMHERYGYFVDILVIIHAVFSISIGAVPDGCASRPAGMGRYVGGYAVAELLGTIAVYGNFLYGSGADLKVWSMVNIAAYFCCSCHVAENVRRVSSGGADSC